MNKLYHIIEVANVHAGKEDYVLDLIKEFSELEGINGIKFQPFKYDKIALEDFSWYEVYKELYFEPQQWKTIIDCASKHWDIWIDTFDDYSFEIAQSNLDKVYGFKFQASTLYNKNLIKLFSQLNLTNKKVILNISGLEIERIKEVIVNFQKNLNPEEMNSLLLDIGEEFRHILYHILDSRFYAYLRE